MLQIAPKLLCLYSSLRARRIESSLNQYYLPLKRKTALSTSGIKINIYGRTYHFLFEFSMTMIDGKIIKLLTGRGGAYCVLCPASREESHNLERIDKGFQIGEVSNEDMRNLFQDLQDEGRIKTKPGDYNQRLGLTQKPITTCEINVFPILHATLCTI